MYFLGVDIGSSSIKTAVLRISEAGLPDAIIGKANIDYPTYYPIDNSSEQSADDWNHAAAVAIKSAVASMSSEEKTKRLSPVLRSLASRSAFSSGLPDAFCTTAPLTVTCTGSSALFRPAAHRA